MRAQLACIEQTLLSQQISPKNPPKRCKQDKSPNLILSVLTYWAEREETTVVDKAPQQTTTALHFWGALFIQWQLQSTPGNTEDIPAPNNVAEELSSKLPSQIGCVASTQLGLKYGNCISHYGAAETAQGEVLKVRRGYVRSDMLCGLVLTQQKRAPWRGDSRTKQEAQGMINKQSWIDSPKTYIKEARQISVHTRSWIYSVEL